MHKHRCSCCHFVWKHDESNAGNDRSHTCPYCGENGNYERYRGEAPAQRYYGTTSNPAPTWAHQ